MSELKEMWRPISGYEGKYEVSSRGCVKSLARTISRVNKKGKCTGDYIIPKDFMLKQQNTTAGYKFVTLKDMSVKKNFLIHRLVAEEFLYAGLRDYPKLLVNHLDFNRANNELGNLEIVTHAQNIWHELKYGNREQVKQWFFNTTTQEPYCGLPEASFYLGYDQKVVGDAVEKGTEINGCQVVKSDYSTIQFYL